VVESPSRAGLSPAGSVPELLLVVAARLAVRAPAPLPSHRRSKCRAPRAGVSGSTAVYCAQARSASKPFPALSKALRVMPRAGAPVFCPSDLSGARQAQPPSELAFQRPIKYLPGLPSLHGRRRSRPCPTAAHSKYVLAPAHQQLRAEPGLRIVGCPISLPSPQAAPRNKAEPTSPPIHSNILNGGRAGLARLRTVCPPAFDYLCCLVRAPSDSVTLGLATRFVRNRTRPHFYRKR